MYSKRSSGRLPIEVSTSFCVRTNSSAGSSIAAESGFRGKVTGNKVSAALFRMPDALEKPDPMVGQPMRARTIAQQGEIPQ